MKIIKIQGGGRRNIDNCFCHNSAADCPISVKFRVVRQFFTEFGQWDRYSNTVPRYATTSIITPTRHEEPKT